MIPTTEILGVLPEKNKKCRRCNGNGFIKHSTNPNLIGSINCLECNGTGLDDEEFYTKDCKCGHCGGIVKIFIKDEIMKYLTEISSKSVGFDRDKLAKLIHNLAWPSSIWENQMELVKERYYKRADAILAHEKEVMVCKEVCPADKKKKAGMNIFWDIVQEVLGIFLMLVCIIVWVWTIYNIVKNWNNL